MHVPDKIVKLCSCDGHVYLLGTEVLEMCATIRSILRGKTAFKNGLGGLFSIDNGFVVLKSEGKILASIVKSTHEEIYLSFPDVKAEVLERVFEYCRYQGTCHTEREKRLWEAEYVQVKQGLLCEVASAAYYLDIKPLVNLTSRAIASQISTKTSEELRETFSNVNCDLYVPMFATRCRLHRKMIQKKSGKDLKADTLLENTPVPSLHNHACTHPPTAPHTIECCTLPLPAYATATPSHPTATTATTIPTTASNATPTAPTHSTPTPPDAVEDTRSLDELLEFIGGDEKAAKRKDTKKKPKKQKKKEEGKKEKEDHSPQPTTKNTKNETRPNQQQSSDDNEFEDELSPEIQAEIDREVEEFRLKLESISCNKRKIPKITLPLAISASLSSLQVY